MGLDASGWGAVASGGAAVIAVGSAIAAGVSARHAGRQADSAEESADAARQMADVDAQRRHDELQPKWEEPRWESAGEGAAHQVVFMLGQGRLDHLVIEICDSPSIVFDVSRQATATIERFEQSGALIPGDLVSVWMQIQRGHRRSLRLRVTSSLEGKQWEPVLLPPLQVTDTGA
ncbi:hypothetical protein ACWEVD_00600 [Nocardia thailandica]